MSLFKKKSTKQVEECAMPALHKPSEASQRRLVRATRACSSDGLDKAIDFLIGKDRMIKGR